ncbi:MAG: anthranilate synthase component I family protein, partial [Crocinitomicaceae bacterium]|nr:anthranilate synthase component I family protein [Crocinitomicaceae bacterium]
IIFNHSTLSEGEILRLLSIKEQPSNSCRDEMVLHPRISREIYLQHTGNLLRNIQLGNIYEVNYCQEFFLEKKINDPYSVFQRLYDLTEAPHACYFQMDDKYLLCASPERFLQRKGQKVISQPIKGTIRRGRSEAEDEALLKELLNSKKERSENVMIVDIVRNDLSKHALKGSVAVDRLFEIKSFRTVHHLISTISADIPEDISFVQLLKDTFPMGSMTGAPKIRAMQLISEHEPTARGWYSGCAGYIDPQGNFDFNVVIRSILYDASQPYISCSVGSAITDRSDPYKEYEECLLKAEALFRAIR